MTDIIGYLEKRKEDIYGILSNTFFIDGLEIDRYISVNGIADDIPYRIFIKDLVYKILVETIVVLDNLIISLKFNKQSIFLNTEINNTLLEISCSDEKLDLPSSILFL